MGRKYKLNHSNKKEDRRRGKRKKAIQRKKITKYDTHWYSNKSKHII